MSRTIAFAADHAGVAMKDALAAHARALGHAVLDLGTHGDAPVDYPDYGVAIARAVADGRAELGVVVCGSGDRRRDRGQPPPPHPLRAGRRRPHRAAWRAGTTTPTCWRWARG